MAKAETLQDLLDRLPRYGTRPAVGLRGDLGLRWWSYLRLHAMALRAAALLAEAGIGRGEHFLVRAPNTPEWVAFFLGAAVRGAVPVPVDLDAGAALVTRLAEETNARLLLTSRALEALDVGLERLDVESLYGVEPVAPADLRQPISPEDPAIIFYTSGTTSKPKGVVLSHGNLTSQLARFRVFVPWVRVFSYRLLVMAPMSHVQGLVVGIGIPLTVGLSAVYTQINHPGHLLRILRENRVTLFSTVPRSLEMLTRALLELPYGRGDTRLRDKLEGRRWRFVRRHFIFTALRRAVGYRFWVVIVGGAPLPPATERFWRNSGQVVVQGYGLTETAAVVSLTPPLAGGFGSVGRPLRHLDVKIAGDGEILVRGPSVTAGAGAQLTEDGYLRTGDLGRLDRRRRLYVVGRKKDVIVTGEGFNVYATDVERALESESGVRDAVVFGLESDGQQNVHAALLLAPGGRAEAVVASANSRLQAHQRIRSWTVWPEPDFPRGPLQKVSRGEVAARGAGREAEARREDELPSLEAIQAVADRRHRLELLARHVLETAPQALAGESTRLVQDLGLSSLDVVELLFLLEHRSGTSFDARSVMHEGATVGELGGLVASPAGRRPVARLYRHNPPRWAHWRLWAPLRAVLRPLLLGGWRRTVARLRVLGLEHVEALEPPVIFAGLGHEHGMDVMLIHGALPRRFRNVGLVASRWVFGGFLESDPDEPWASRLLAVIGLHFLVPLFFPLALTSHYGAAREGLLETCLLIDRGFSPIVFEGRGVALVALQTGVPIVPVFLDGNDEVDYLPRRSRPEVTVRFGEPLAATPDIDLDVLIARLEALFPA